MATVQYPSNLNQQARTILEGDCKIDEEFKEKASIETLSDFGIFQPFS